eukprot:TRINITY_DN9666_c0_g1_i1.p1 TRINITY_DN9666_c0_g1~~TRINITY_DN9666_c0_g1_i1.p1  ORF type:complete len:252 (+),score=12.03 TRINITY_DN9666_c0_g1_i1:41-796(+)
MLTGVAITAMVGAVASCVCPPFCEGSRCPRWCCHPQEGLLPAETCNLRWSAASPRIRAMLAAWGGDATAFTRAVDARVRRNAYAGLFSCQFDDMLEPALRPNCTSIETASMFKHSHCLRRGCCPSPAVAHYYCFTANGQCSAGIDGFVPTLLVCVLVFLFCLLPFSLCCRRLPYSKLCRPLWAVYDGELSPLVHDGLEHCTLCEAHTVNVALACSHAFCGHCLDTWRLAGSAYTCPACRAPICDPQSYIII